MTRRPPLVPHAASAASAVFAVPAALALLALPVASCSSATSQKTPARTAAGESKAPGAQAGGRGAGEAALPRSPDVGPLVVGWVVVGDVGEVVRGLGTITRTNPRVAPAEAMGVIAHEALGLDPAVAGALDLSRPIGLALLNPTLLKASGIQPVLARLPVKGREAVERALAAAKVPVARTPWGMTVTTRAGPVAVAVQGDWALVAGRPELLGAAQTVLGPPLAGGRAAAPLVVHVAVDNLFGWYGPELDKAFAAAVSGSGGEDSDGQATFATRRLRAALERAHHARGLEVRMDLEDDGALAVTARLEGAREGEAGARQDSAGAQQEGAAAQQKTAPAQQEGAAAQQKTAPAQQETAAAQQEGAAAQQEAAAAQQKTAPAQQETAAAQQEGAAAQQETAAAQQKPASAQQATAPAQPGREPRPGETWGARMIPPDAALVYATRRDRAVTASEVAAAVDWLGDATAVPATVAARTAWRQALERAFAGLGGDAIYAVWPGRDGGVGLGGALRAPSAEAARDELVGVYPALGAGVAAVVARSLSLDPERHRLVVTVRPGGARLGTTPVDLVEVAVRWPRGAAGARERRRFTALFGDRLTLALAPSGEALVFAVGRDWRERLPVMIAAARGERMPSLVDDPRFGAAAAWHADRRVAMSYVPTVGMTRLLAMLVTPDAPPIARRLASTGDLLGRGGAVVATASTRDDGWEISTRLPPEAVPTLLGFGGSLWRIGLAPLVNPPTIVPLPLPPANVTTNQRPAAAPSDDD